MQQRANIVLCTVSKSTNFRYHAVAVQLKDILIISEWYHLNATCDKVQISIRDHFLSWDSFDDIFKHNFMKHYKFYKINTFRLISKVYFSRTDQYICISKSSLVRSFLIIVEIFLFWCVLLCIVLFLNFIMLKIWEKSLFVSPNKPREINSYKNYHGSKFIYSYYFTCLFLF